MSERTENNDSPVAPMHCYRVLSQADFEARVASRLGDETSVNALSIPFTTADSSGEVGYPAFQLERVLNTRALDHLLQMYAHAKVPTKFL